MTDEGPVIIPVERLDPAVLAALIEEFVTRDGTDYGVTETSLAKKCAQVRRSLDRGEAVITFDAERQSATIVTRDMLRR